MRKVTRNEADYDEIFSYAEEYFDIDWNECNTLFFSDELIPYKGHRDFSIEEMKDAILITEGYWKLSEERKKAYQVIIQFMDSYELDSLRIYGTD